MDVKIELSESQVIGLIAKYFNTATNNITLHHYQDTEGFGMGEHLVPRIKCSISGVAWPASFSHDAQGPKVDGPIDITIVNPNVGKMTADSSNAIPI